MRPTITSALLILAYGILGFTSHAAELGTAADGSRLDRLYFPVGEESHVYRYAPLTAFRGDSSIYRGYVEHAWQGVSVSLPTDGFFDSLPLDSLRFMIETASIDSFATVVVGTDIDDLALLAELPNNRRVELERFEYGHREVMFDGLHAGHLDGVITQDLTPNAEDIVTISHPLPYLAVIMPNVGREINFQGQLTTSLYYRFNKFRLLLCFDGDQVQMANRLTVLGDSRTSDPAGRLFGYNPERGRQLFEGLAFRPSQLNLQADHPALDRLAHFFADIISRDRCSVAMTDDRRSADVRLEFVPLSESIPSAAIYRLFYQLVTDSLPGRVANEHLRRIGAELRFVESPPHPEDYYRHLDIAGRIMMEDLGVLPLFRPTLFLHTTKHLQNVRFDADGRLDFSRALLVDLPEPPLRGIE